MQISDVRFGFIPGPLLGAASDSGLDKAPRARPASTPVDRVEISDAALESSKTAPASTFSVSQTSTDIETGECPECAAGICTSCGTSKNADQTELSEEEQSQVEELRERDAEVRAHEAAHAMVGGSFAGSPSYEYQVGPDGKRYAIGGEVSIDTAPIEGDPQATIDKLQQVQAAAMAPAEPSGQDRKVAQQAAAGMREAQAELAAQKRDEITGEPGESARTDEAAPDAPGVNSPTGSLTAEPENAETVRSQDEQTPAQDAFLQQVQQAATSYQRVAALA